MAPASDDLSDLRMPLMQVPDTNVYSGYQEVRLQAAAACLGLGEPPASLTAVLQVRLRVASQGARKVWPACASLHGCLADTPFFLSPCDKCQLLHLIHRMSWPTRYAPEVRCGTLGKSRICT